MHHQHHHHQHHHHLHHQRQLDDPVAVAGTVDEPGSVTRRDRGQATTEYALILLAAALVAVLVIGWATAGGGAAAIGRLFDSAINAAIDQLG